MYIDAGLRETSEKLLDILSKVKELKLSAYEQAEKRYKFNLSLLEQSDGLYVRNFVGKDIYVREAINTEKFCFKPEFIIKQELYANFSEQISSQVVIGYTHISYEKNTSKNVIPYNNIAIYDKINIIQTEHCRVSVLIDDIMTELPNIGSSNDGLPFFEDGYINEASTSGWWIEGNSIHFFINSFKQSKTTNIKLIAYYNAL
jgi:hypothetical protein